MGESRLLFKVNPDVEIEIETIEGDFVAEGYDGDEFLAVGDSPTIQSQEGGESLSFFCSGDCRMRIPQGARLEIASISGDCRITGVINEIEIETISGDCEIRSATSVEIETVSGDLLVRDIQGDVRVETVGADASVRNIQGDVNINDIGADAEFRNLEGDLGIDNIGGDALLKLIKGDVSIDNVGGDLVVVTPFDGELDHEYDSVGGDAAFKLEADADVRFVVPDSVKRIIKVRNARLESDDDEEVIVLAEGKATVTIHDINGSVMLMRQEDKELDDLIEDFSPDEGADNEANNEDGDGDAVLLQWERQRQRAEQEAMRRAGRAAERAGRAAERATERIRRDAERVKREAERAAERAMHKARHGFNFEFDFDWPGKGKFKGPKIKIPITPMPPAPPIPPVPPAPPAPPKAPTGYSKPSIQPVTDEERMLILKMVESKQISVDDAERLFAALEGRDIKDKG